MVGRMYARWFNKADARRNGLIEATGYVRRGGLIKRCEEKWIDRGDRRCEERWFNKADARRNGLIEVTDDVRRNGLIEVTGDVRRGGLIKLMRGEMD